jgi:hypothetical protein
MTIVKNRETGEAVSGLTENEASVIRADMIAALEDHKGFSFGEADALVDVIDSE